MTTTPTNEAGHGLPKLPQTEEFALRAMATNYGEGHRWDSLDRDVCRRAADEIKILRERIVALSRGVPADMVLVPRKLTSDMADAYMRLFTGTERFSAERMWDGLLAAAPGAAGAQGEAVCSNCNGRGEVGGPVGQTAETFDYVTEPCPDCNAPQPAAADGGVRESKTDPLNCGHVFGEFVNHTCFKCGWDFRNGHPDPDAYTPTAALSSHRQAGDHLSQFRELAEEWKERAEEARQEAEEEKSEVMYYANRHEAAAYSCCAYAVLALVEKGAGS